MIPYRRAGISLPLFSIRSSRSWGIGEIGDVPALAEWLRASHQSVLQILPLNELAPGETSPYSSLSAMAIDPQFISIWMLEDSQLCEELWRGEIEAVRGAPRIDYQLVRDLKGRALRLSFDRFYQTEWLLNTPKAEAVRSYVRHQDWWIHDYSLYRAIRARQGERPWGDWPAGLRDGDAAALAEARGELEREILFYQYVQWVADDQWQMARQAAGGVEILGDFPFMVTRDSADVWSRRGDFLLDAQVGTPPDAFSETGQEWGLPPYDWDAVRGNNFAWLRMRARRMAELYDGFRIDHLVGFYRTYVRPFDERAPHFFPAVEEEQIALGEAIVGVMIETGADVSAEDLGTVPEFVRESIARLGVPGYKVLRWEPGNPQTYPVVSVAMTGTHDTEPLAVWWESLTPKERIPLVPLGNESPAFSVEVRDALLQLILNAGSSLVLLPIQDVFGWRDRMNLPATVSEANWTYALPWPVDRLLSEPEAMERAEHLTEWTYRTGRWVASDEVVD
ncbi:MAG: 4-alpha-glucanotransferase [Vicinamibacterales bacterium]|nr:4-alpha-glucanotransferase [Vicinamibacterales bacterium]